MIDDRNQMEEDYGKSFTAICIFFIATALQFVDKLLALNKRKASMSEKELQLRAEIKRLLKEAAALSQPSTFAQAAKLRRTAAAKEKELAKSQESLTMEMKTSFGFYERALMISKIVVFAVLTMWFWGVPVAAISKELVQPFGWFLSWKARDSFGDNVMRPPKSPKVTLRPMKKIQPQTLEDQHCTLVDFIEQGRQILCQKSHEVGLTEEKTLCF